MTILGGRVSWLVLALCSCSGDDDDTDTDTDPTDAAIDAPGAEDGGRPDGSVDLPPVAIAGEDRAAETRARVTLDARESTDPEGQPLGFAWAQTEGLAVELDDVSGATPTFVAPADETELAFELTVSDGTLAATDDVRVRVVRLTGPRAPIDLHPFLPRLLTPDARGVAVSGGHAFVADASAGLVVFDLAALPGSAAPVAEVPVEVARTSCLEVQDDLAYVGGQGLTIFDVSDPENPALLSSLPIADARVDRLAVSGPLVHLGGFGLPGELVIVDATDPTSPVEASRPDIRALFGLAALGDWAYVTGVLRIEGIDATDPSAPVVSEVSSYTQGRALVAVPGADTLVVSCPRTYLLDASDPGDLQLGANADGCGSALALSGSRLFLTAHVQNDEMTDIASIGVVDIGPEPSLTASGSAFHSERSAWDIDVWGDTVLVAAGTAGVLLVDTAPDAPEHVRVVVDLGAAIHQVAWLDRSVVATSAEPSELHVVDSDGATVVGSVGLAPAFPQDLTAEGTRAYVAGDDGVRIVDLTDPSSPEELGFVDIASSAVAVSDTTAYVGTGFGDVSWVYDVSDPGAPVQIGAWDAPFGAGVLELVAVDGLLLVGDYDSFAVFDVANPSAPAELLGIGVDNVATAVAGADGLAYTTDIGHALEIYDVRSRPPQPVASFERGRWYRDIAVRDGFLYAVAGGIHVLDVSDPATPVRAGFFDTGGWYLGSIAAGDAGIAVAAEDLGVVFVDDMRALELSPERVLATRSEELEYSVAWIDRSPDDEQVACVVTAGSCRIDGLDLAAATATVVWALPGEAGDQDLAVVVGTARYFLARRDRVRVE